MQNTEKRGARFLRSPFSALYLPRIWSLEEVVQPGYSERLDSAIVDGVAGRLRSTRLPGQFPFLRSSISCA